MVGVAKCNIQCCNLQQLELEMYKRHVLRELEHYFKNFSCRFTDGCKDVLIFLRTEDLLKGDIVFRIEIFGKHAYPIMQFPMT